MRRREFIATIGSVVVWPLAARGQQSTRIKHIALVVPSGAVGELLVGDGPFKELSRLGYVEGKNLIVDRYSGEGRTEKFAELAQTVIDTAPDLIFAVSNLIALAFKAKTATIPIVASVADPIKIGLVTSLARPNGNVTGVASDAGLEIVGKRLGLLVEATSTMLNSKYLISRYLWENFEGRIVEDAAKQLGIVMTGALLEGTINEDQYRRIFTAMERDRVDALMVSGQPDNSTHRKLIIELAAKSRIPAIYAYRDYVVLGGLMAYAIDLDGSYRRAAYAVDQILRGASPGDIPFYQQTKFDLVINLKTARELGITIPPTLLGRADEVIE